MIGQKYDSLRAECAGKMRESGIYGDNQIKITYQCGGIHKCAMLRIKIVKHNKIMCINSIDLIKAINFLQTIEFGIR